MECIAKNFCIYKAHYPHLFVKCDNRVYVISKRSKKILYAAPLENFTIQSLTVYPSKAAHITYKPLIDNLNTLICDLKNPALNYGLSSLNEVTQYHISILKELWVQKAMDAGAF